MQSTDTRWHQMRGGITRYDCPHRGNVTVFTLQVSVDGKPPFGQRIEIETWRLEYAGNYRRVLDAMTRDIQARL